MATLKSILEYLIPHNTSITDQLRWPPNIFALCAYVLKLTGSYNTVLDEWPPQKIPSVFPISFRNWESFVEEQGKEWRAAAVDNNLGIPLPIQELWNIIISCRNSSLEAIGSNTVVVEALLALVAVADAACEGVGIPSKIAPDEFEIRARELLAPAKHTTRGSLSTLCPILAHAQLCVLPKQHTPRGGLTLRSLTHHLALHIGADVAPFWHTVPNQSGKDDISLNVLIAPWPLSISPSQFQPASRAPNNLPNTFGYVEFTPVEDPKKVKDWTKRLIKNARSIGGQVDCVIFPEAALTLQEYVAVRNEVLKNNAFLIAGVLVQKKDGPTSNLVMFDSRIGADADIVTNVTQHKHHRWRLDRSQIEMYGLAGTLDPNRDWWEHIEAHPREVNFLTINNHLSICCLACEDLARQEPVADLVRSVGPNLVVALLMDAPQLGVRWPTRYATVLADDPGSSVLTVTSAGMVDLTRTPPSHKPSRSIGLWKDARSNFIELELPKGSDGLLLNLWTEYVEEWTIDGRSDHRTTGYTRLGGVHMISNSTPG